MEIGPTNNKTKYLKGDADILQTRDQVQAAYYDVLLQKRSDNTSVSEDAPGDERRRKLGHLAGLSHHAMNLVTEYLCEQIPT